MLSGFYRWLNRKLNQAALDEVELERDVEPPQPPPTWGNRANKIKSIKGMTNAGPRTDSVLNFQIYAASGGYIFETTTYDSKTDRHDRNLHIIRDDADLGSSIAQIITVEMLRR